MQTTTRTDKNRETCRQTEEETLQANPTPKLLLTLSVTTISQPRANNGHVLFHREFR